MLRRLFKGRHPLTHPDAEVRRAAIRDLDAAAAESLADDLARLLKEDPDPGVRHACLARIDDRALLESLCQDPGLGDAAAERLAALGHGTGPGDAAPALNLPADLPLTEAAERLRGVDDVDALADLALKARGELRRLVLEQPLLQQAAGLTRLEKRSRDRDKSVNRHARTRLERYRQLQGEADAHRARAEELAEALHRNPPAVRDRAWRERQHQLHHRLGTTLDAYGALREELTRFGEPPADLESLRGDPDTLPALEAAPAAAETAAAADSSDPDAGPGNDPFEALVEGFRDLDQALAAGRTFAEIAAQRQALTDRWLTAADHQPPAEAQHQVFERVSHRFRELADAMERLSQADIPAVSGEALAIGPPQDGAAHRALWDAVAERRRVARQLERVRRQVAWPPWAPATTEYAGVLNALESLREELGRADDVLGTEVSRLEEQITALESAIDEGSLNNAQSLLTRSRTLHDALPAAAVRRLDKPLGKQAARLAELKDWQTFATSPKREALAEAMETLAAEPRAPREQADRIKALRREWQALGPITQAADGRLADRFNGAAETAFETCRAYFAEQAELRKANLAERRRICDQLEQYLQETDWHHADMKGAEQIMRAARDEWRRFHPVDRNPGKSVEARFEALQGRLHDLVKAEWDRNLKAKQDIVDEAEALLASDMPIRDKVEAAKGLQRRWREVGITPRRPDQRLWRAFRGICDRIFSVREESRQAADAALDELEARLHERLEAFATALDGLDAASADPAAVRMLRQETADLDRLPPNRRRALGERRTQLLKAYSDLLASRQRADRREALGALARWDEAMTAAEMAQQRGESLPVPPAPGGDGALAQARLAGAGHEVPREAARRLAVKAELAAGRESPAEDESLRLEIQVERLQAGLSGGGASEETPQTLADAWCRLGPKDGTLAPLRERLFAALDSLC